MIYQWFLIIMSGHNTENVGFSNVPFSPMRLTTAQAVCAPAVAHGLSEPSQDPVATCVGGTQIHSKTCFRSGFWSLRLGCRGF